MNKVAYTQLQHEAAAYGQIGRAGDSPARTPEIQTQLSRLEQAILSCAGAGDGLLDQLREGGVIRVPPTATNGAGAAVGELRAAMQTTMGERLQRLADQIETMAGGLQHARGLLEV